MYREEVPLYDSLLKLVAEVNRSVLETNPNLKKSLEQTDNLERISVERHGAIRLGKSDELFNIRRLFDILGMYPVAYYDLSLSGIPVHSTAFRPIDPESLSINPFRVFTSLLRTELISDTSLRQKAECVLDRRNFFPAKLLAIIDVAENNGGLSHKHGDDFISMSVDIFRWHDEALVDAKLYEELHDSHRLLADVVSFKGPHINHLTPSTLDIDEVQRLMPEYAITPKAIIEGPPKRKSPILLRQTAFKALQEPVKFLNDGVHEDGYHTARFGEVEQRGIALTVKGQALYDTLMSKTLDQVKPGPNGSNSQEYLTLLEENFSSFPDNHDEMRIQGLAFFHYSIGDAKADKKSVNGKTIEELVDLGYVRCDPIIYEDFLPVSAAGIFQSNLGNSNATNAIGQGSNQALFEKQLGVKVIDRCYLYEKQQQESMQACLIFFND
jgi:uncharacterized glyoxalase superfamily metalloenzyme YdcJ